MKVSNFEEGLFGLEPFAARLEKFISVEHNFIEGSLVIALSSSFGTGKSTFLNMWKDSLENRDDEVPCPLVVNINAWESDYYGDPLFAIISALIDKVIKEGKSADTLMSAAKDFGWMMTAIGNQIAANAIGVDAVAAGEFAKAKKEDRDESKSLRPDSFSVFEDRKKAMISLQNAIQIFVEENESQVLFLVDELDRCRPDYAISFLETIKHLFDVKGAVFILAADRHQLECSAKTAFGADLKFDEYYRKFIHREISLPKLSRDNYNAMALKYVPYYLERVGARSCFMKPDSVSDIAEIIAALELTPRQIQEVFRILGHIFETSNDKRGRLLWCLAAGSILMATLKIGHADLYKRIGSQSVKPKEVYDFLKNTPRLSKTEWWFTMLLTGGAFGIANEHNCAMTLNEVGIDEKHFTTDSFRWRQGWGDNFNSSSQIVNIFDKIEQLSKWDLKSE